MLATTNKILAKVASFLPADDAKIDPNAIYLETDDLTPFARFTHSLGKFFRQWRDEYVITVGIVCYDTHFSIRVPLIETYSDFIARYPIARDSPRYDPRNTPFCEYAHWRTLRKLYAFIGAPERNCLLHIIHIAQFCKKYHKSLADINDNITLYKCPKISLEDIYFTH